MPDLTRAQNISPTVEPATADRPVKSGQDPHFAAEASHAMPTVVDVFAPDMMSAVFGEPQPWQERALCAQTDPEAFFPEKGGSTREAKRICQRCPVQPECLQYALSHDERFGIWGGYSERERRRIERGQYVVELPGRLVDDALHPEVHDYRRYLRGCRCEICQAANTQQRDLHRRREAAKPTTVCRGCGQEFTAGRNAHYCSNSCRQKAYRKSLVTCHICGTDFHGDLRSRYCSKTCRQKARRAAARTNYLLRKRAEADAAFQAEVHKITGGAA